MEKIAPVIAWLSKNRFWLASAFLTLGMLGAWFMATGAVTEETSKFTSAIKSQISSGNAIKNVTAAEVPEDIVAHPNDTTEEGMKEEMSRQVDDLVKARRARHQAQASILKWPTEIIGAEEFVKVFGRFDPPETFPSTYKGLGMEQYLKLYRTNIPRQMDKIAKAVRTNWQFSEEKLAEMRGNLRDGRNFDPLSGRQGNTTLTDEDLAGVAVVWERENQSLWYKKLTEFQGYDDHKLATSDPTPLQVYMLQQDLWLLEAVFDIIKQINGDADASDLSTIKKIDHIAFGREALSQVGELTPIDARLGGAEDGAAPSASAASAATPLDQAASTSPFHGRYVDADFKQYSADDVRDVITGKSLPEENIELIVSKRVPVRIGLVMDERKIAEFLAACANSPFAFEIHQVRLNRHNAGEGIAFNGGASAASGGRGGMGMDMGMDMGMGMGGMRNELELKSTPVETRANYDVRVEFYGIVKIYNPVREKFLREAAGLEEDIDPNDAAAVIRSSNLVAIKE